MKAPAIATAAIEPNAIHEYLGMTAAVPDASTGQGDLARVVSEIGPPAHERHLPGPVGPVQHEGHRGLPGASPELTPGVDRAEQAFDLIEEVSQRALW